MGRNMQQAPPPRQTEHATGNSGKLLKAYKRSNFNNNNDLKNGDGNSIPGHTTVAPAGFDLATNSIKLNVLANQAMPFPSIAIPQPLLRGAWARSSCHARHPSAVPTGVAAPRARGRPGPIHAGGEAPARETVRQPQAAQPHSPLRPAGLESWSNLRTPPHQRAPRRAAGGERRGANMERRGENGGGNGKAVGAMVGGGQEKTGRH